VKARKLGKREQRAAQFIASRVEYSSEGSFLLEVEWKRSATWGSNPHVYDFDGSDCVSVSGCGYCKLSTAMGDVLRFLPGLSPEQSAAVWQLGGTGESSVLGKLSALTGGQYQIVRHYWHKGLDVYRVTRAGVAS
jgi:hypothetical protein